MYAEYFIDFSETLNDYAIYTPNENGVIYAEVALAKYDLIQTWYGLNRG